MNTTVREHLALQAGVISRRQAIEAGLTAPDIRRLLRRREWALVHPGVYVAHTGPMTWVQRAWAGVLHSWPAALCHESALRAGDGPGLHERVTEETIHVAVDRRRTTLVAPEGIRLHHLVRLAQRAQWNLGPPRLRYEEAALDVAVEAETEMAAIAALAKACQTRRTTAHRLVEVLASRPRVPRRQWLAAVLTDVADGTCSVLEHGYLNRVERPHGLPRAERQVLATASTGVVYRDAQYGARCLVELDGRLFHDTTAQRDLDFDRDLDAAAEGRSTTRLSWGQVFDRPCATAARLVQVLQAHGIGCRPRRCGPGCAALGSGRVA